MVGLTGPGQGPAPPQSSCPTVSLATNPETNQPVSFYKVYVLCGVLCVYVVCCIVQNEHNRAGSAVGAVCGGC